jgi:hypothetical protein
VPKPLPLPVPRLYPQSLFGGRGLVLQVVSEKLGAMFEELDFSCLVTCLNEQESHQDNSDLLIFLDVELKQLLTSSLWYP